jgi:hypothetical protein
VPREDYVTALLALTGEFRDGVKTSASPRLQELGEVASNLASVLPFMLAAITSTDDDETVKMLRQLKNQVRADELATLRRWAVRRERDLESGKIEEERANAGQFVQEKLANAPSLEWTLDPETESKLSGVRLSGNRAAALDRYLTNVRTLRSEGVELTMRVATVPPSFAVVARDPASGEWGRSQAAANFTLEVLWMAGKSVQIGLVKLGADQSLPCAFAPARIFEIQDRDEVSRCEGTGGAPTRVFFEELDQVLRERLADPLAEAFAP